MDNKQNNIKKAVFVAKKMFAQLVYDFQSLEGMPFSFPEVQTFIQGITIGGHKISDQKKLEQQQLAWQKLIDMVEQKQFQLSVDTACELEYIVAKDEALEPGVIRNGAVSVTSGDFTYHPPDFPELPVLLKQCLDNAGRKTISPCKRGYKLALDFAWNQFYWDGNKRTGNLMMNGLFMGNGILPCSVPAVKLKEYNTLLMDFYKYGNFKMIMNFLQACHRQIYMDWQMDFPG